MTAAELAELATRAYGEDWQASLARDRKVGMATVRHWAEHGIEENTGALVVGAYLLSRRIVDLPPALGQTDDERDDDAHLLLPVVLDTILEAGRAVGWHDAELLAAMLSYSIDRMIEGAGAPAVAESLKAALAQVKARTTS